MPSLEPAPGVRPVSGNWEIPARREPSLVGADTFLFLGKTGALSEIGWDGPQLEKLWRYNQHYFDDLNARDAERRAHWHRALMLSWVADNPPVQGNGWEPYPTSLRIVNWVKWALAGHALPPECLHSLAVQARWLSRRLEIHLLGNHLFANAKALVFVGLFFDGDEAQRWLRKGLRILNHEVSEQILGDGGHFERSTMYHALALEDVLDLINLFGCYRDALVESDFESIKRWRQYAAQMLEWLNAMRHPDGEIAFFNDAAFGIAPSCDELVSYAVRLGISSQKGGPGSKWLSESGYVRLEAGDGVALLDLAPIGPDYLPGHAHADTLSFELSVFGRRFLVNSGTSCYGNGAERLRQRSTAAHNTVVVAGQDSSEVWSGFRVARRARPLSPQLEIGHHPLRVECAHDGYARLAGRPIHKRRWEMTENSMEVKDFVSGGDVPAQARFHFHPEVELEIGADASQGGALLPNGRRVEWRVYLGKAHVEPSTWHPRFGESQASHCLCVDLVEGGSRVHWRWA